MFFTDMNRRSGFSLLEVILAIGIAAIAILTLLVFFAYSLENIRVGKSIAHATALAQRRLEYLKSNPDEIKRLIYMVDDEIGKGVPIEDACASESEKVSEAIYDPDFEKPVEFTITTNVKRLPPPQEYVADIWVVVTWKYKNLIRKVVLETYYNLDYAP